MKKVLRVLAIVVGAVVVLSIGGYVFASIKASARIARTFETHRLDVAVPFPLPAAELEKLREQRAATDTVPPGTDPLLGVDLKALASERAIAHGKHLVEARYGCNTCHGKDMGGGVMMDEPPIASLHGPNITTGKGGVVAGYTMADWDRIVRHGVKRDGTQSVMPSADYFSMSDHELSDIVAYIRSLPPVDTEQPKPSFGPIGKVLVATEKYPLSAQILPDHFRAHAVEPPLVGDTAEFGGHLAATCTGCHRGNLAGGPMPFGPPDWPPASNLTKDASGLGSWSFEDFEKALVEGVSKDGRKLREPMTHVIPGTKAMTQTERKALWTYLNSVKPFPTNP